MAESNTSSSVTEQSREGPVIGGISRSVTVKCGVKRKMEKKTMDEKYQAIMEVEKGHKTKAEIARMFNIPKQTLSGWVKKSEEIKEGYQKFGPKRKVMRSGDYPELEEALVKWLTTVREKSVAISGPILMEKAASFADKLGIKSFKQSVGWLDRFKERNGISFKTISGEAKSVDLSSQSQWKTTLDSILKRYKPCDIYNADETGIFYKMMPDKTLEFKNVDCSGGKKSKERLTVMVCSNMDGTDKLPLLVIGKSATPRCFKGVKTLPTEYDHQKKAWMNSDIFANWLNKFDRKMARKKRKVAMIIDNCPAHPQTCGQNLTAVEVIFLPKNTTSKTQPMDQGVIYTCNLKLHYKKQVVEKYLCAIERDRMLQINVLDAMRMMKAAWTLVPAKTIENCFRHADFVNPTTAAIEHTEDSDEDDVPLATLARRNEIDIEEFNNIDKNLPTCEEATDDSIISEILSTKDTNDPEEEEDDDKEEETTPKMTIQQCVDACIGMRTVLEAMPDNGKLLDSLHKIQRRLERETLKQHFTCTQQKELEFYWNL